MSNIIDIELMQIPLSASHEKRHNNDLRNNGNRFNDISQIKSSSIALAKKYYLH